MPTFMVEYTYDSQASRRDEHRPAHRAYLESLVATGVMAAYGRFADDGAPGALLLVNGESPAAIDAILAADPFVTHGLVPSRRIREWAGTWGAITEPERSQRA